MATYVVIPRLTQAAMDAAREDDPRVLATVGEEHAARLFPGRSGKIAVSSALYLTDAFQDASRGARRRDGVQVLDGLNAYLVEDLTAEERESIGETADVVENIEIGVVPPIAVSSDEGGSWHLDNANVSAAWGQGFRGAGIRIGILDTGIDADHPEFAGKHISFMEFDASGFPVSTAPRDAGDHGTHVAGIAAGATCGVAPDADLAVAAVLTHQGEGGQLSGYLAQILAGFNWLVHHNHSVAGTISKCPMVNASLGKTGFYDYLYSSVEMQFVTLRSSLLVAAIGNSGRSGVDYHWSPGNYDIAVGIGAVDAHGIAAPFSDWGLEKTHMALKPDLCAAGVAIRSAVPGGGYASKSGTSMASPAVAAAAALLIQKYPGYARNPGSLKSALVALVDPSTTGDPRNHAGGHSRIGSGRLDLTGI